MPSAVGGTASVYGIPLRGLSLVTLAVQNSFLIVVMRYSRTLPGDKYLASTAVLLNEVLKLAICIGVFVHQQCTDPHYAGRINAQLVRTWLNRLFGRDSDVLKLSVPAILYTLQNNLQYLAVSNLDAATFQVTYQLKILTTALFSVLMLGRRLSAVQWASLLCLTAGVALVQLPTTTTTPTATSDQSKAVGLIAVITACCLSGLAGVYFEKILKKSPSPKDSNPDLPSARAPPTLWERNIQLALFGAIMSLIFGVWAKDGDKLAENGFFHGYTPFTYLVIFTQATGGLLVALVVKYADNILKGFATSISIIISCVLSIFIFDFIVTLQFVLGSMLVIYATYLYDSPPAHGKPTDAPCNGYCPPLPFLK